MKPRIITRYILLEYIQPLILGIVIFTFVLLLDKIFDMVDLLFNKGVGIFSILKLLCYIFPNILSLTIPMGFLLGSLLTYGRLSEDGEITAFRASGQHLMRIIWPPMAGAVLVSCGLMYLNCVVSPNSHNAFRTLYREVLRKNPLFQLEEKTFLKVQNMRLYVNAIDKDTGALSGVHIYRIEKEAPPTRIHARSGIAATNGNTITFNLKNGTIQQLDKRDPSRTTITSFTTYDVRIPIDNEMINMRKNIRSMTTSEISSEIKAYRAKNIQTHFLQTEYHLRLAIAFAPLAFGLIGSILGIKLQHGGKSIGFGLSLLIIFIYYLLLIGGIAVAEKGYFIIWLDLWMSNVIIGLVCVLLLFNLLKK